MVLHVHIYLYGPYTTQQYCMAFQYHDRHSVKNMLFDDVFLQYFTISIIASFILYNQCICRSWLEKQNTSIFFI